MSTDVYFDFTQNNSESSVRVGYLSNFLVGDNFVRWEILEAICNPSLTITFEIISVIVRLWNILFEESQKEEHGPTGPDKEYAKNPFPDDIYKPDDIMLLLQDNIDASLKIRVD